MFEELQLLIPTFPWLFAGLAFCFGACWGSFLNVVIYRTPQGKSVVVPGSHCGCGKPIAWFDNIPILSWFLLRGKARCCGASFSFRYPFVELLTGILFMLCWLQYWQTSFAVVVVGWFFLAWLVAGAFIDFDTQMLPDWSTIGLFIFGVAVSAAFPSLHGYDVDGELPALLLHMRSGVTGLIGAFVATGLIVWIAMLAEWFLKKEAMGFGDALLLGAIGSICGWQGGVFALFGGAVVGSCIAIPLIIMEKLMGDRLGKTFLGKVTSSAPPAAEGAASSAVSESAQADAPETGDESESLGIGSAIPFGPWIAAGGALYFVLFRDAVDAYFASIQAVIFSNGLF